MKITIDTKNDSKEEILRAIKLIHHIIHNPDSNCLSNNSPSNNVYSDYSNTNDAFNFSSDSPSQANTNPQPTVYNAASNSNQPLERPIQQITPFNALFGDLQTSNLSQQSNTTPSLQKELPVKPSTELKREKPKFSVMGFETY